MSLSLAEHPFSNLARQAGKMMDQMQKGFYVYSSDTWTPNVNLYETATSYLVCVDLAGVDKDKIDLEVHDGRLRLRGSRPVPIREDIESEEQSEHEHKKMRVHLMEIDHGSFSREVELPSNINCDAISASYRNGMLWVEIPKA
jgi:HSP20 family protein